MTDGEKQIFGYTEALRYINCTQSQLTSLWYMDNAFYKRAIQTGPFLKYPKDIVDEMKEIIEARKK